MLERVTFTGVDQKTKIKELEALQKKYPFVEFGFIGSIWNLASERMISLM